MCPNEGTRSLILEIACYIASQSVDSEPEVNDSRPSSEFSSISLPTDEEYVAVGSFVLALLQARRVFCDRPYVTKRGA